MTRQWSDFHRLSGFASIFTCIMFFVVMPVIMFFFGEAPANLGDYFELVENSLLVTVLVSDIPIALALSMYLVFSLSLWKLLKSTNEPLTIFSVVLTYISVSLFIALNADFALIRLALNHAASNSEVERQMIRAAGEALMANNSWNSTGAYFSGVFMQGAGVSLGTLMLRSSYFRKTTAIAGIWGNGFDLVHHVLYIFAPSFASVLLMISAPGYILWFILMGLDLFKVSKNRRGAYSEIVP